MEVEFRTLPFDVKRPLGLNSYLNISQQQNRDTTCWLYYSAHSSNSENWISSVFWMIITNVDACTSTHIYTLYTHYQWLSYWPIKLSWLVLNVSFKSNTKWASIVSSYKVFSLLNFFNDLAMVVCERVLWSSLTPFRQYLCQQEASIKAVELV